MHVALIRAQFVSGEVGLDRPVPERLSACREDLVQGIESVEQDLELVSVNPSDSRQSRGIERG